MPGRGLAVAKAFAHWKVTGLSGDDYTVSTAWGALPVVTDAGAGSSTIRIFD